jgi:hypothetical protein
MAGPEISSATDPSRAGFINNNRGLPRYQSLAAGMFAVQCGPALSLFTQGGKASGEPRRHNLVG